MDKQVVSKECKYVIHLPKLERCEHDVHIVKENIVYTDGSSEPNLRVVYNFKRPFWITKPHLQNHKQKKESERLDNLNMYTGTEVTLHRDIGARLGGKYAQAKSLRDIRSSPYVYGIDVDSRAIIKKLYMDKYPDVIPSNTLAVLDIEVDTLTNEMIIVSVACHEEVYIAILSKIILNKREIDKQLKYLYDKYIPETELSKKIKPVFELFDTEIDMLKAVLNKLHMWKKDFVAVWNIDYDIPYLIEICKKYNVDPKDIFSDPNLPKELRYFEYKQGAKSKLSEGDAFTPINPEEQWHNVITPSFSYWIDAMCAHRYIRVGGKTMPGGYSLDNILQAELGSDLKKLKFKDDVADNLFGIDWHRYMVKNKPLEYVIYNAWDTMSILELDNKTKDLSSSISALANISSFSIFNSGPKKIIDGIHFYYMDQGSVLAAKPARVVDDSILGLDNWILMLPSDRVKGDGGKFILEDKDMNTNIRTHVLDLDAVSSYPSNTQAANVSKDTTTKELLSVGNYDKDKFKLQNINLFFGKINAVEYCTEMFNFPKLDELDKHMK